MMTQKSKLTKANQFRGCIIGGAIGDAFGSSFENQSVDHSDTFYLFNQPKQKEPVWQITDDTQLTVATIEGLASQNNIEPEIIANTFLKYFKQRKLSGLGASTLKALRELEVGGYWAFVGRKGEYAAGNGAAMRVAPLAFYESISKSTIRDICSITHNNDEAYVGALSVVLSIQAVLSGKWSGSENLIELLIPQLPDTRVRDRLIEIKDIQDLRAIGELGNDGYVVNSVPLAIAAANQIDCFSIETIFENLIAIGGDTDTNCSIAGQIIGSLIGIDGIPLNLIDKLKELNEYQWINQAVERFISFQGW